MALKKYREAVKECTAALRIHTHYMKAMLRRGRCFARIRQYEEAIAEYERYIQLVIEARKSPQHASNSNAACTFDRPMDITEAEYNKAKQELVEVKKSMRNAAAQDQAQEKKQREQQFIFNKNFKAAANDAARRRQEAPTAKESAYTRKKQWDAGVNQRPWDTFDGSSPKKMNAKKEPPMSFHPSGGPNAARKHPKATMNRPYQQPQQKQQQQQHHYQQQQHQQQHRQQQQQQPPPPISKPTDNGDHYQVLGLLPTATATEIKKAYHKMALKYHPDKNSEEDAADIFRRVKLAYEVLGNEQSRVAYDSLRRVGRR
jgi:tetratricopeptide (TPR) repeat protein